MQRALMEAQSEKQAVMQAGEVLLAELEQLHEARDDAQRRLTGAGMWINSLANVRMSSRCRHALQSGRRIRYLK